MRAYLMEANHDLLLQIEVVQELLGAARVQAELTHYLGQVAQLCAALRQQAMRNLKDLEYDVDETTDDILAATQSLTAYFELVNARLASPIVRARKADRLGLLTLRWLHDSTPQTAVLPCGMADGNFAIYPTSQVPLIYLTPVTRQVTLLYLPLLFHEFGHLLYACHKEEMDDLVKEFQKTVAVALAPTSVRDQRGVSRSADFRRRAVTAGSLGCRSSFATPADLPSAGRALSVLSPISSAPGPATSIPSRATSNSNAAIPSRGLERNCWSIGRVGMVRRHSRIRWKLPGRKLRRRWESPKTTVALGRTTFCRHCSSA